MVEPNIFPNQPDPKDHLKKESSQEAAYTNISKSVTALGSRLRILEEQYANLRNKNQLADRNLLDFEKELREEIKSFSEDILEIKGNLQELKEKVDVVSSEMKNAVKEHDIKVVEKYIDLWNPGRFVTRTQLKEELGNLNKKV